MSKIREENATCIVCGKKYHLCIACERSKATWKPWKMVADTENCYEIYKVLNDYNFNKISKEEARKLLEKLDLKDVNTFKEKSKNKIKEIMKRKKAPKIEKIIEAEKIIEIENIIQEEKVEASVADEIVAEEIITEEIIETVEEKSFEE
jgi:hypothetical protein